MFQNFIPASSWRPLNRNTDLWNVPWLFAESKLTTLSKITPQTMEQNPTNCKFLVKDITAHVHQEASP